MKRPCHETLSFDILRDIPEEIYGLVLKKLMPKDCLAFTITCREMNEKRDQLFYWKRIIEVDPLKPNTITDTMLKKFPNLALLRAAYCSTITNDGISHLTNLKTLDIHRCANIEPVSLLLQPMTRLTTLRTSDSLVGIDAPPCLKFLSLTSESREAESIDDSSLERLTNLVGLSIDSSPLVTDSSITKLTKLRTLFIQFNHTITDTGIQYLTNLTKLDLRIDNQIKGQYFHHLRKLRVLHASFSCKLRPSNISGLTQLVSLDLSYIFHLDEITDETISSLTNLTSLCFIGADRVTDASIARLTKLEKLEFRSNPGITDKSLGKLCSLNCLSFSSLHLGINVKNLDPQVKIHYIDSGDYKK